MMLAELIVQLLATLQQWTTYNLRTGHWFLDIVVALVITGLIAKMKSKGFTLINQCFQAWNQLVGQAKSSITYTATQTTRVSFSNRNNESYVPVETLAIVHHLIEENVPGLLVQNVIGVPGSYTIVAGTYLIGEVKVNFSEDVSRYEQHTEIRHHCTITSVVMNQTELVEFVEELVDDHQEFKREDESRRQKMTYIIWHPDPKKIQRFPFRTARSFENYFGVHKKVILDRLGAFRVGAGAGAGAGAANRLGSEHKLVLMLSGAPGTGKTSLIKAIAAHTGRHILSVPLNLVRNLADLMTILHSDEIGGKFLSVERRIIVMEDTDAMGPLTHARSETGEEAEDVKKKEDEAAGVGKLLEKIVDAKKKNGDDDDDDDFADPEGVTLSDLLNALDGILALNGAIVVFTTNHPEKLDPALVRDKRVDLNIVLGNLTLEVLEEMIRYAFELDEDVDLGFVPGVDGRFTPAHVTTVCENLACGGYREVVVQLNREATS